MWNKKGYQLKDLTPIALLFVVSIIALAIGTQVLETIADGQCPSGSNWNGTTNACSNGTEQWPYNQTIASNITGYGITGMTELASWYPTLALVIAAALIISILVISFAMGRR